MASIATDSPADGTTPVSLHPMFPLAVALWFAALLGLGTLLVPIALLERVVVLTGIASTLPPAAPPLGMAARLAIAVAGTIVGALFGWVVARHVAASHLPADGSPLEGPAAIWRPLSASEDLDEDGIGAAPQAMHRSPGISVDEHRSDFLWAPPLPDEDTLADLPAAEARPELAQHAPDPRHEAVREPEPAPLFTRREQHPEPVAPAIVAKDEALDLGDYTANSPLAAADPADLGPVRAAEPLLDFSPPDSVPIQFPSADEIERRRLQRRNAANARAPGGFERRLYLRRAIDDPVPFEAPSLARRTPDNENGAPTLAMHAKLDELSAPVHQQPEALPEVTLPEVTTDWENAPLGELGMIDLVHRLGATLEKRRGLGAVPPARAQMFESEPKIEDLDVALQGIEAAEPDDAAQAMAAYFARPADEAPSGAHSADERADDAPDDADYGSLLSLRNPFTETREESVRVDERAFGLPEQAGAPAASVAPVPAQSDEALRRALATLQRMSRGG